MVSGCQVLGWLFTMLQPDCYQSFLTMMSGCQVLGWLSTMLLPDCLPVLSDQGEWLSCIRLVIYHVATRLFTSPF